MAKHHSTEFKHERCVYSLKHTHKHASAETIVQCGQDGAEKRGEQLNKNIEREKMQYILNY